MTSSRERTNSRALAGLGRARFVRFVRAIRLDPWCEAARTINEELDFGRTVDTIFFDGEKFGYHVSVRMIDRQRFRIEFGCQAGPLAGEGGTWEVVFGDDGEVVRVESRGHFIA